MLLGEKRETCHETDGREASPVERIFSCGVRSTFLRPKIILRRALHNGHAGSAIRTHNTLSAEDTRVQVFYPFHPLRDAVLQVVRRPKRGDGAVAVMDTTGK